MNGISDQDKDSGPEVVDMANQMAERALPRGSHQERNKQSHVDTTALRPVEHNSPVVTIIQNADVAIPWLVDCACLMMSSLRLQVSLQEWTGKEINGTSDSN